MDLHHNLYYSYRGLASSDVDRDRQLENNLTKALINTLSLGGEEVWQPFIRSLGVANPKDTMFLLQRRDLPSSPAASKKLRVLLGISRHQSHCHMDESERDAYESVPDGWIYGNGFAILVECKVRGDFTTGQMGAHIARLVVSGSPRPKAILKTWAEIHDFFYRLLPKLPNSSTQLLVSQFVQFLEYSGMSGFTGFRREHFEYFLLHDDEDSRLWVLDQINEVATLLLNTLRKFSTFYDGFEIGNLKRTDAYCWVAFGPKDREYRQKTHQTIAFGADGVRIFINAELQDATDRVKAVTAQSQGRLLKALLNLHRFEDYSLELDERLQKQASIYWYIPKLKLYSSTLAEATTREVAWQPFCQLVDHFPLFELRIERLISPSVLLKHDNDSRAGGIQYIAEILKRNHAVVALLNQTADQ